MAHIKCRGCHGICMHNYSEYAGMVVGRHDDPSCGAQYGCGLLFPEPEEPSSEGVILVGDPTCRWLEWVDFEFEKDVKRYEYDGLRLKLRGATHWVEDIEYLEIDGRVLVGTKEDGG